MEGEDQVSTWVPDFPSNVEIFEGALVKATFPSGQVQIYEGAKGQEHLVKTTFLAGQVFIYEGAQGQEHFVNATFLSGKVGTFEDERGKSLSHVKVSIREMSATLAGDELIKEEALAKQKLEETRVRKAAKKKAAKNRKKERSLPVDPSDASGHGSSSSESLETYICPTPTPVDQLEEACISPALDSPLKAEAIEEQCCVICLEGKPTHVMIPCGHVCTCSRACADSCGSKCPICREVIREVIPIYLC